MMLRISAPQYVYPLRSHRARLEHQSSLGCKNLSDHFFQLPSKGGALRIDCKQARIGRVLIEDRQCPLRKGVVGDLAQAYPYQLKRDSRQAVRAKGRDSSRGSERAHTVEIPLLGELSLPDLTQVTPLKAAKWVTVVAVAWAVISATFNVIILNPTLWMYASWFLVVWPWPAAITLGIWTLVTAAKQVKSGAQEGEQYLILFGALLWLILVPLAHFHGFVDGMPIFLFSLYYFFFSISAFVRSRLYGTLSTPIEDKRWQSSPALVTQIAFVAAVVGGHWLAAYESTLLVNTWIWDWKMKLAAAVITLAVVANWNAIYFLGKYSDRLVTPRAVVMFGPYRWVRHPIYASYILLFAGYCLSLRSNWSLLFLMLSCIFYYEQRTKVEENLLVENFGELYTSYREKTRYKYLPWVY